MENLDQVVAFRMQWGATLSEEQKAAVAAERAAWANEESKGEREAELAATFQTSDTNADGLLDRSEFEGFMKAMQQNAGARGLPTMDTETVADDMKDMIYALYNAQTAGVDGVSIGDFVAITKAISEKIKAALA